MAGEGGEFVGRADEGLTGKGGQLGGNGLGKAFRRVQSSADGGAALGQFADRRERAANDLLDVIQLGHEGR